MIAEVHNKQYGIPKYAGQTMSKADFLRWESDDNYVYEFNDGILEPTTGTGLLGPTASIRQKEGYLLTNLENYFYQTNSFQTGGCLRAEMNIRLTEKQTDRPDVAYFTADLIRLLATDSKVVPLLSSK